MSAEPAVTPVITPVEISTVATASSLEVQSPPGLPEEVAFTVASKLTTEEDSDIEPASGEDRVSQTIEPVDEEQGLPPVYVIFAVPPEIALIFPELSTLATLVSSDAQVPPG
jgi:hypothetical protein